MDRQPVLEGERLLLRPLRDSDWDALYAVASDRGDRYAETIFSDSYLAEHGLLGCSAAWEPVTIRYGVDVAEQWSRAELPHDGSQPYHTDAAPRTSDLAQSLGLW